MPIEIDGESVDAKHEGEIDVVAWSWGLSLEPASGTGGGAGSDRVRIENIPIQKLVDLASRLLAANSERLVLANVPLEDLLRSRASVRLGRLVVEFKLGKTEGNALVQRAGKACSGRNADHSHGRRGQ
jgi:Type VI secretion system effector, Hcp